MKINFNRIIGILFLAIMLCYSGMPVPSKVKPIYAMNMIISICPFFVGEP